MSLKRRSPLKGRGRLTLRRPRATIEELEACYQVFQFLHTQSDLSAEIAILKMRANKLPWSACLEVVVQAMALAPPA